MIRRIYSQHKENTHNYLWRTLQTLGTHGTSFFIFYLCSKLLTPSDFGIYNLVFATIFFLVIFCNFGISTTISKYAAEYNTTNKERLPFIITTSGLIIIVLGVLTTSCILLFGDIYFSNYYNYLVCILPVLFLHPLYSLYDELFNGLKRFKEQAIISLITGSIISCISYLLIIKYGIYGALIAHNFLYLLLFIALSVRYGRFKLAIEISILKSIVQYAVIIGLTQMSFFFRGRVDYLFLGKYNYIIEIGYFAIAYKLLKIMKFPFSILTQIMAANITKNYVLHNYDIVKRILQKGLILSILLSGVIVIFFLLTKGYLIQFFFPKYNDAKMDQILYCMLPVYLTYMAFSIIPRFVIATGHAKWNFYFALIMGILNVVLDYVLINIFGYLGIIYSSWVRLLGNVVFVYLYYQMLNIKTK